MTIRRIFGFPFSGGISCRSTSYLSVMCSDVLDVNGKEQLGRHDVLLSRFYHRTVDSNQRSNDGRSGGGDGGSFMSRLLRWNDNRIAAEHPVERLDKGGKHSRLTQQKADQLRAELLQEMESVGSSEDPPVDLKQMQSWGHDGTLTEEQSQRLEQFVNNVLVSREGLTEMEIAFLLDTTLFSSVDVDRGTGALSIPAHERQAMKQKEEKRTSMKESLTKRLDSESALRILKAKGLSDEDIRSLSRFRNLRGDDEYDENQKIAQQKRHQEKE